MRCSSRNQLDIVPRKIMYANPCQTLKRFPSIAEIIKASVSICPKECRLEILNLSLFDISRLHVVTSLFVCNLVLPCLGLFEWRFLNTGNSPLAWEANQER